MSATNYLSAGAEIGGSYRLHEELARGGFGVVWGAEHLRTQQHLAVKVLDANRAALRPGSVERFLREARITAKLRHPNTVRVFDVGGGSGDNDPLYLVMERLFGPTLEHVLHAQHARALAMSELTAIDLALPILGSLAEAHAAGLVHRDLKPGNLMLNQVPGDEPVVKVLDFGCTYVRGSQLTVDGNVFGTPGYMSPEQIVGDPIDARTDLYALALILYRCVTGRAPFIADQSLALLYQFTSQDVPNPREFATQELSQPMVDTLLKALERSKSKRYTDAHQMRTALENVRDAVRAAARSSGHGRDTMVDGTRPGRKGNLASLVRLVEEVPAKPPMNRLRTESDQKDRPGAETAVFAGEVPLHFERTSERAASMPSDGRQPALDTFADASLKASIAMAHTPVDSTPQPLENPEFTHELAPAAPSAVTPADQAASPRVDRLRAVFEEPINGNETESYSIAELSPPMRAAYLGTAYAAEPDAASPAEPDAASPAEPEAALPAEPEAALPAEPETAPAATSAIDPHAALRPPAATGLPMRLLLIAALLAVVAGIGLWVTGQGPASSGIPVAAAGGLPPKEAAALPPEKAPAPPQAESPAPPAKTAPLPTPKPAVAAPPEPAVAAPLKPAAPAAKPIGETPVKPATAKARPVAKPRPAEPAAKRRPPRRPKRTVDRPSPPSPSVLQPKLLDD